MSEFEDMVAMSSSNDFVFNINSSDIVMEIDNEIYRHLISQQQSSSEVSLEYCSQQSIAEHVQPMSLSSVVTVEPTSEIPSFPLTQKNASLPKHGPNSASLEEEIDASLGTSSIPQGTNRYVSELSFREHIEGMISQYAEIDKQWKETIQALNSERESNNLGEITDEKIDEMSAQFKNTRAALMMVLIEDRLHTSTSKKMKDCNEKLNCSDKDLAARMETGELDRKDKSAVEEKFVDYALQDDEIGVDGLQQEIAGVQQGAKTLVEHATGVEMAGSVKEKADATEKKESRHDKQILPDTDQSKADELEMECDEEEIIINVEASDELADYASDGKVSLLDKQILPETAQPKVNKLEKTQVDKEADKVDKAKEEEDLLISSASSADLGAVHQGEEQSAEVASDVNNPAIKMPEGGKVSLERGCEAEDEEPQKKPRGRPRKKAGVGSVRRYRRSFKTYNYRRRKALSLLRTSAESETLKPSAVAKDGKLEKVDSKKVAKQQTAKDLGKEEVAFAEIEHSGNWDEVNENGGSKKGKAETKKRVAKASRKVIAKTTNSVDPINKNNAMQEDLQVNKERPESKAVATKQNTVKGVKKRKVAGAEKVEPEKKKSKAKTKKKADKALKPVVAWNMITRSKAFIKVEDSEMNEKEPESKPVANRRYSIEDINFRKLVIVAERLNVENQDEANEIGNKNKGSKQRKAETKKKADEAPIKVLVKSTNTNSAAPIEENIAEPESSQMNNLVPESKEVATKQGINKKEVAIANKKKVQFSNPEEVDEKRNKNGASKKSNAEIKKRAANELKKTNYTSSMVPIKENSALQDNSEMDKKGPESKPVTAKQAVKDLIKALKKRSF